MKKMFLLALATVALAACSNDETTSINKGQSIDFRAATGSRATETTTANIQKFYASAIYNDGFLFKEQAFTKESGSQYFVSDPLYYWPANGTVDFVCFSPSATDLGGTLTTLVASQTLTDFAPAAAIADQQDFITATASGSKAANETTGVPLVFEHRLSQIEVKALNKSEAYTYKITGVRIGKPVSKGTFDFGTKAWTLASDKANYQVEYATPITLGATAASVMDATGGNAMLLPQQLTAWTPESDLTNTAEGAYLALKINIITKAGGQVYPATIIGKYDWAAVAIPTNWEAGKKYTYTLDFSNGAGRVDPEKPKPTDPAVDPNDPGEPIFGSPIKFTVVVTPWEEAPGSDINM